MPRKMMGGLVEELDFNQTTAGDDTDAKYLQNQIMVNFHQVVSENYKGSSPEDYETTYASTEEVKLDRFHYHEMLDRLYLIIDNIQTFLLQHPVAEKHKKLNIKIEKASELLAESYQMITGLEPKSFYEKTYTQKEVDKMMRKVGVLSGKDARIFLNNINNPKPITPEVRERMYKNYHKINALDGLKKSDEI